MYVLVTDSLVAMLSEFNAIISVRDPVFVTVRLLLKRDNVVNHVVKTVVFGIILDLFIFWKYLDS